MKNISLNLSNKLDSKQISLLCDLHNSIQEAQITYFIIGAYARDLIMQYGYGIKTPRITLDKDIAIQIDTWAALPSLKNILMKKLAFKEVNAHRLTSESHGIIDIIPFGGVQVGEEISWPPEHEIKMNVLGFNEAYSYSIQLQIKDIYIPVCSLPGLVVLKLVAWVDRNYQIKDASDIGFILHNYLEAGNKQSLYDIYSDLLSSDDFDYVTAGARVLGRDIGKILSDKTANFITNLLDDEINQFENRKLIFTLASNYSFMNNPIEYIKNVLKALRIGITEFKTI